VRGGRSGSLQASSSARKSASASDPADELSGSFLAFRNLDARLYKSTHAQHIGGCFVTEPRAPGTTVELPPPGEAGKVLLVDDDFGILDGVAEFLEGEGFLVVPASNGIDALGHLRSGLRVDAIVLDVMMPIMDGWDFRAEQLADPSLRDIPVLVISASGFTHETLRQQLCVREVLPKPLNLDGFLRVLKATCGDSDTGSTSSSAPT
jgi:CheY-like chemotaxis protein